MNRLRHVVLLPALLLVLPAAVHADPWKDESGHGKGKKHERREFKEEYWDGNCKVERKLEKNGEYKEERKCKPVRRGQYEHDHVYVPAPAPVVVEPGITIHGTVRIPQ